MRSLCASSLRSETASAQAPPSLYLPDSGRVEPLSLLVGFCFCGRVIKEKSVLVYGKLPQMRKTLLILDAVPSGAAFLPAETLGKG